MLRIQFELVMHCMDARKWPIARTQRGGTDGNQELDQQTLAQGLGDALGDEIAAMEAQVAFIGVTAERDNFVGKATVRIPDFASQALVRAAIQAVAAPNAT